MFLQGCLLVSAVLLQVVTSAPLQDDKIQPVDLNYLCIETTGISDEERKSPILLIHGLGASLDNWNGVDIVLALRTDRKVCAIDLRNHGGSPWSNQSDINAMTEDIGHFLNSEKIEKINLIGHSLGGKLAVHFTLKHPERVDSVVVEDMRPNGMSDEAMESLKLFVQLLEEGINAVPQGHTENEAKRFIVDYIRKKLKEIGYPEEIDEDVAKQLPIHCPNGKCQFRFNIDLLVKSLNDVEDILIRSKGVYEGKAMFIYGVISPFKVAEDKENIMKLFPNAKLVGISDAGHIIHGKFSQFNDEVIKFLND